MIDVQNNPKYPFSGLTVSETDELEAAGWSEVLVETVPETSMWRHPHSVFDRKPADALAIVRSANGTSDTRRDLLAATTAYELRRLGWADEELENFSSEPPCRIDTFIEAISVRQAHRLSARYRTLLVEALTALRDGRYDTGERERLDEFMQNPPPDPLDIEATISKIANVIERKTGAGATVVVYRDAEKVCVQANSRGTTQFSGSGITLEAAIRSLSRAVVDRTMVEAERLRTDAEALAASVAALLR